MAHVQLIEELTGHQDKGYQIPSKLDRFIANAQAGVQNSAELLVTSPQRR